MSIREIYSRPFGFEIVFIHSRSPQSDSCRCSVYFEVVRVKADPLSDCEDPESSASSFSSHPRDTIIIPHHGPIRELPSSIGQRPRKQLQISPWQLATPSDGPCYTVCQRQNTRAPRLSPHFVPCGGSSPRLLNDANKQSPSPLTVPGSSQRFLDKSRSLVADCLTYDLEDSVTPHMKAEARSLVRRAIDQPTPENIRERAVRINSVDSGLALGDLSEVVSSFTLTTRKSE